MAEIVYRQMPAPRDIPQKIPAPRAKIRMQKPQSGGEFSVQIPEGARGGGGWSWQKLITALSKRFNDGTLLKWAVAFITLAYLLMVSFNFNVNKLNTLPLNFSPESKLSKLLRFDFVAFTCEKDIILPDANYIISAIRELILDMPSPSSFQNTDLQKEYLAPGLLSDTNYLAIF